MISGPKAYSSLGPTLTTYLGPMYPRYDTCHTPSKKTKRTINHE